MFSLRIKCDQFNQEGGIGNEIIPEDMPVIVLRLNSTINFEDFMDGALEIPDIRHRFYNQSMEPDMPCDHGQIQFIPEHGAKTENFSTYLHNRIRGICTSFNAKSPHTLGNTVSSWIYDVTLL